jgi:chaperonin cofactor prefoldin
MELEKFEQAKKVKENLDRLERQKYKLETALESCSLNVTIEFNPSKVFLTRKDEVSVYSKDAIKEMISKELDRLNSEIELVKEEFEKV